MAWLKSRAADIRVSLTVEMLSFFLLFCTGVVPLYSVALPPLHWITMTLKDCKVTKGEKHQIPSLAHGEVFPVSESLWPAAFFQ